MTYRNYYSDGTVSVSNGSTTVTGSGTAWELFGIAGGELKVPGYPGVFIESVTSDGELVLAWPWPHATQTNVAYSIGLITADQATALFTNRQLSEILRRVVVSGVTPDGAGTIADRDALDPVPATGFVWLRVEVGEDLEITIKTDSGWEGPYPVRGEKGADSTVPGPPGAPGSGVNWQGPWSALEVYAEFDGVEHQGSSWIANATTSFGDEPGVAATWDLWVEKGEKGDTGDQGDEGPSGDGAYLYIAYASDDEGGDFSLSFDPALHWIAFLSTTAPVTSPVASDFSGLWKNYRGEKGDTGDQGEAGNDGADGALWYAGTADPGSGLGQNGDFYLQTGTGATGVLGDVWEKAGGAWAKISNIRGASGSGTGDVVGPDGGVTDGHMAVFDGITGKLIKSGGAPFSGAYGDLSGIPSSFTPSAHGHEIEDVAGLAAVLTALSDGIAGKANASHTHPISDITDLSTLLNEKAPLASPTFTGTVTVPDGSFAPAKLDNGAAVSVLGRSANSSGARADIAAGANDRLLARVGDALSWVQLTIGMMPDALITFAKMASGAVATFAEFNAATASKLLSTASVWADSPALTDGATIAVNFNNGFDFGGASNAVLLLGGNRTLSAPTNARNSKKGILWFGATGATRTLTLDAAWNLATGVEAGPYSITTSQELGVAYTTRGTTVIVTAIVRRG